ncbi:MAG: hypothetical protein RLZZ597_2085 [Cyanobacteriota bacterium]|jgi:hypothetical protein
MQECITVHNGGTVSGVIKKSETNRSIYFRVIIGSDSVPKDHNADRKAVKNTINVAQWTIELFMLRLAKGMSIMYHPCFQISLVKT